MSKLLRAPALGGHRPARRRRPRLARALARRDDQRRLAAHGRRLHLPRRLSVLQRSSSRPRSSPSTPTRRTPAERLNDGRDFVPTNKWIVFGHHFAAIAGPGPLVGPTLAAQFGYLPGTLWIIVGVVLGGAVQDFVILCSSVRRDGKSLGQMAKEEIGPVAGFTALVAVLGIMIVLIAVLALVVVNALQVEPVGHRHHRAHDPHRPAHGRLPAVDPPRPRARGDRRSASCCSWSRCTPAGGSPRIPRSRAAFTLSGTTLALDRDGVRLRRVGAAGVAAARAARLSVGVREDRRRAARSPSASSSCCRRCRCRRSRSSPTAPARSSPARCFRSPSSRSPAARSPASTR